MSEQPTSERLPTRRIRPLPPSTGEKYNTQLRYVEIGEHYDLADNEVAKYAGVSRMNLHSWKKGLCVAKFPPMLMLAKNLGVPLETLLDCFGFDPLPEGEEGCVVMLTGHTNKKREN